MRISLNIPDDLINEAMKLTHHRSKSAVVIEALEDLVRKYQIAQLKRFRGRVNLDIDLDTLRDRRELTPRVRSLMGVLAGSQVTEKDYRRHPKAKHR